MSVSILIGDVRDRLKEIPDNSIHCVVTSPPYWGLRDYGVDGQLGLESTPAEFIKTMVAVFEDVRRVLRPDGTCWVNMGDSYATGAGSGRIMGGDVFGKANDAINSGAIPTCQPNRLKQEGFKPKDLCMMPHRLAIALQDAGWWVRQDIVWSKPNPMPESVRDRCTKSHEYIFLLTKSSQYFYDADAVREPVVGDPDSPRNRFDTKDYEVPGQKPQKRMSRGVGFGHGTDAESRNRKRVISGGISKGDYDDRKWLERCDGFSRPPMTMTDRCYHELGRNKRSVWTIATHAFREAHFATFPTELAEICIKAGCPIGGTVLDPFFGAGTTGLVADRLQRNCIGIELNPTYASIAKKRIEGEAPLLTNVEVAA